VAGRSKNLPGDQLDLGFGVPRAAKSIPRAPAERDLVSRPHTRLKLDSLRTYLPEWFGVMSNLVPKLGLHDAWFIDAFAGPGRYKDGAGSAAGSPAIACQAAQDVQDEAHRKGRVFTPHLRFIEISRDVRRQLATELKAFDGVVDYEIIPGDAMVKLPWLLSGIHPSDPLLLFLDPNGFAPVTFALLASLGSRPGMTEVLLSVDALRLRRAHAASETAALTAFSGGTWWTGLVDARGLLDVNAYLGEMRRKILGTGFHQVGYRHLRFLSQAHNHRAIIQACGSPVARQKWAAALDRSAASYVVIADLSPDLDRRQLVDATLAALRGLAGQRGLYWNDLVRQLDSGGVEPNEPAIRKALCMLREIGLADFDRPGRDIRPRPRFAFRAAWPTRVSWDRVARTYASSRRPVVLVP
jgi:three-Cys-motif partner protein